MEREELLRGSGIGPSSSNSGLSRRDMYLKESTHLHGFVALFFFSLQVLRCAYIIFTWRMIHYVSKFFRSHGMVNDQISIAMETKEHLLSQRQQFKRLQTRFNDMTNRFPIISR